MTWVFSAIVLGPAQAQVISLSFVQMGTEYEHEDV